MKPIELFDGAIYCSLLPLIMAVLGILHVLWTYWKYCWKRGYKIDFWHCAIGLTSLQILFMYPFAASARNVYSIEFGMEVIAQYVDDAFWISFVGFVFCYIGFYLCTTVGKIMVKVDPLRGLMDWLSSPVERAVSNRKAVYFVASGIFVLEVVLLVVMIQRYGFSFNFRLFAQTDPDIRPAFNAVFSSAVPILLSWLLLLWLTRRTAAPLAYIVALGGVAIFTGNRSILIFPVINALLFYWMWQGKKLRIWRLVVAAAILVVFALMLEKLRNIEEANDYDSSFVDSFFYGNNSSDLRDFGWLLSRWDGDFIDGKSYLAGILSFIPRANSEFRDEWGWGKVSLRWVKMEDVSHPGLRTGPYGEMYFNFGWTGVVLWGLIGGYMVRLADLKLKEVLEKEGPNFIRMYGMTTLCFVGSFLYTSGASFQLYMFTIIVCGTLFVGSILRVSRQSPKEEPIRRMERGRRS